MFSPSVALLSEEFPPFMFGGIGAVTYDLACNLSKRKIRTTVFCGNSPKIQVEKPNEYLEIVRLPCLDLPPRFLWFQVQNFLNIARRRGRYHVIHSVSHQMAFLSVYLKRKLKIPLITSYHGVPFYDLKTFADSPTNSWTIGDFGYQFLEFPLNEALVRVGLRNSDKVVACSKTTLNELSTLCSNIDLKKSMVIPNGIDLEKVQVIKKRAKNNERVTGPSIIFTGRLYYSKGITYILQALEHLIPDYPNLRLNIFGTGPMESKIQDLIRNRNLKGNVVLHGQVNRNQLMEETLAADVAVFPSLREAEPMSVLEAMALEKPVVVFNYSFTREIVRDQDTGFLTKPKDSKELATKIDILLSDKKLRARIGKRGYEYVAQHHNWEKLVNKYIDLYEACITPSL